MIECLVGSYGHEKEQTLHWLSYDLEKNNLEIVNAFAGLHNPSYLTLDQANQNAYIISEVARGTVSHFKVDRQAKTLIDPSSYLTHGGPCYVGLNQAEDVLMVANYGGGSLTTYGRAHAGQVTHQIDHYQMPQASRLHTIRQMGQSPYYMALDIGRSELICYEMVANGRLKKCMTYQWQKAVGPRELAFHPSLPLAYVVHEYENSLSVLAFDVLKKTITLKERLATIDDTYGGKNYGAAIEITADGQKLYLSNRGHESLTAFKIADDGTLSEREHYPVYGQWPRHFTTVDQSDLIMLANEKSNEIVVTKAGEKLQTITIPRPVCIQMFKPN